MSIPQLTDKQPVTSPADGPAPTLTSPRRRAEEHLKDFQLLPWDQLKSSVQIRQEPGDPWTISNVRTVVLARTPDFPGYSFGSSTNALLATVTSSEGKTATVQRLSLTHLWRGSFTPFGDDKKHLPGVLFAALSGREIFTFDSLPPSLLERFAKWPIPVIAGVWIEIDDKKKPLPFLDHITNIFCSEQGLCLSLSREQGERAAAIFAERTGHNSDLPKDMVGIDSNCLSPLKYPTKQVVRYSFRPQLGI